MNMKRILSSLIAVCLLLGCMSITAMAQPDNTISVGNDQSITVNAGNGYVDETVVYSFTAAETGTYFLDVSYARDTMDLYGAAFFVGDGDEQFSFDQPLEFSAVAGETVELSVNYFGIYSKNVTYTVSVIPAQPLEGIVLSAEQTVGIAGDYLYIDVTYLPEYGKRGELTWTVSDTAVAELGEVYADYAELNLLSAGTVVVTAATSDGLSASVEITVTELGVSVFVVGKNPVAMIGGNSQAFTFTPEFSGYYTFETDSDSAVCSLNAACVDDGQREYYELEAGETYEGEAYAWSEELTDFTVTIDYHEDLQFSTPAAFEITKLPDNITYLKEGLRDLWSDEKLAGLELKLTWPDGSVMDWSFDENEGRIGIYSVGGFLNEKADGGYEVEVYISDGEAENAYFDLIVLDIVPKSLELVNPAPMEMVEFSSGMRIELFDAWLYLPVEAYTRQVKITFSDGSEVIVLPGETVYGHRVECTANQGVAVMETKNQPDGFWGRDTNNLMTYTYCDLRTDLQVKIIDSPVESIELLKLPVYTEFVLNDAGDLVAKDGTMVESYRQLLKGIRLKVVYKDGAVKTYDYEDIQWLELMGDVYPVLDGYPVGVLGNWLTQMLDPVPPCELEGYLEYKGVEVRYPIYILENDSADEDDRPGIEPIPGTGDTDAALGMLALAALMGIAVVVTGKKKYL